MRTRIALVLLLSVVGGTSARAQSPSAPAFKHENTAENLKALMETMFRRVHVQKRPTEAVAMLRSLVPDEARLKAAFRTDAPAATIRQVLEFHQSMQGALNGAFSATRPEQTVTKVSAAATEQIAAFREGSVPARNFPGGAKGVAERFLRPGLTFYEVEFLEPGDDLGVQFHLFYWDGKGWSMLGPLWHVLK